MRKTNRFLAGPQVSGDSFFGRRSELDRLGEWMFGAIPCCGLSIVGPHRIGKSSLVAQVLREHAGQENVLVIRMNMAEYPDAASFWYIFAEELENGLRKKGIWDDDLERAREKLECVAAKANNWYIRMRQPLINMLSRTRAQGLRVLWVLDEFDAARWVLDEKCYFQFIRTLSSETDRYNMTTILISRSPVAEIERSADGISTFHGVFATFPLYGFNDLRARTQAQAEQAQANAQRIDVAKSFLDATEQSIAVLVERDLPELLRINKRIRGQLLRLVMRYEVLRVSSSSLATSPEEQDVLAALEDIYRAATDPVQSRERLMEVESQSAALEAAAETPYAPAGSSVASYGPAGVAGSGAGSSISGDEMDSFAAFLEEEQGALSKLVSDMHNCESMLAGIEHDLKNRELQAQAQGASTLVSSRF